MTNKTIEIKQGTDKKNITDKKLFINADLYQSRVDLEDDIKQYLEEFKPEEIVVEGAKEHLGKLGLSDKTTIWGVRCVYKK